MSILSVHDIQGIAAYNNTVRVPSGNILDVNELISQQLSVNGTLGLPTWTTETRPQSPSIGFIGYNTSDNVLATEIWNGEEWTIIGSSAAESLPVTSGLLSWYDGDSWNSSANRWDDKSGNANHSSNTTGTINVLTHTSGSGSSRTFKYIAGNTASGVRLSPPAWPSSGDYTFFHVTRYTGGTRARIWQGTAGNWLSGHWSNGSGRFYHEGWMSSSGTNYFGDDWFITLDQNDFVRTNRGQYTFSSGGNYNPGGVAINTAGAGGCCNSSETSDWACAVAIVYNRKLSSAEYQLIENFIFNKYF